VTNSYGLNIYDLLYHEKLLISKAAVEELSELLDPKREKKNGASAGEKEAAAGKEQTEAKPKKEAKAKAEEPAVEEAKPAKKTKSKKAETEDAAETNEKEAAE
jgi:hypothetical protein